MKFRIASDTIVFVSIFLAFMVFLIVQVDGQATKLGLGIIAALMSLALIIVDQLWG